MIQQKRKFSKERKGVIVQTTFRGTKTLLIAFQSFCLRYVFSFFCDDSAEKKKYSKEIKTERKGVIVKVKTTFEGTKTLLVAWTGRKYNWKGATCYPSLFPQNTKER